MKFIGIIQCLVIGLLSYNISSQRPNFNYKDIVVNTYCNGEMMVAYKNEVIKFLPMDSTECLTCWQVYSSDYQ